MFRLPTALASVMTFLVVACGGKLEPRNDDVGSAPSAAAPSAPTESTDLGHGATRGRSQVSKASCQSGTVAFREDFCCPPGASCGDIASWPFDVKAPCDVDCSRVCPTIITVGERSAEYCEWGADFTIQYHCGWCSK
jgi:hypothetical protein